MRDINWVKKINPDGSKTLYVGGIYEVDKASGGSVTRTVTYYPVAGAMRINSTLYYVLKDHLGSASVVTDASGNIVGENRYYPFGETRLSTGSILTDKLYTGQREMAGLGIYHYQARFYSPYLNHFIQPDTIVPNPYNPQSLNRYSYTLNNPIRYNDPSGHTSVCAGNNGDPECYAPAPNWMPSLSQMGITLDERWTPLDAGRIQREAAAIATSLLGFCGEDCSSMTSYQAFHEVFGDTTIAISGTGYGCQVQSYGFSCGANTVGWLGTDSDAEGLIIHEFGHVFDHNITGEFGYGRNVLGSTTIYDESGNYVEGIPVGGGAWTRTNDGYRCITYPCQQHPLGDDGANIWEDFADMFMNLVLDYSAIYTDGGFASNPAGQARYDWMHSNMTTWVPWSIQR